MSESTIEAQNDEREALVSIYDGDNSFKEVDPKTYQYKVRKAIRVHSDSCKVI